MGCAGVTSRRERECARQFCLTLVPSLSPSRPLPFIAYPCTQGGPGPGQTARPQQPARVSACLDIDGFGHLPRVVTSGALRAPSCGPLRGETPLRRGHGGTDCALSGNSAWTQWSFDVCFGMLRGRCPEPRARCVLDRNVQCAWFFPCARSTGLQLLRATASHVVHFELTGYLTHKIRVARSS